MTSVAPVGAEHGQVERHGHDRHQVAGRGDRLRGAGVRRGLHLAAGVEDEAGGRVPAVGGTRSSPGPATATRCRGHRGGGFRQVGLRLEPPRGGHDREQGDDAQERQGPDEDAASARAAWPAGRGESRGVGFRGDSGLGFGRHPPLSSTSGARAARGAAGGSSSGTSAAAAPLPELVRAARLSRSRRAGSRAGSPGDRSRRDRPGQGVEPSPRRLRGPPISSSGDRPALRAPNAPRRGRQQNGPSPGHRTRSGASRTPGPGRALR